MKIILLRIIYFILFIALVIVAFITYYTISSECNVSNALKTKMEKALTTKELKSARPYGWFCPTLFFYKKDNGEHLCAEGNENIFRGPEISFGSCG